jgi:hypothetical protein
MHKGKVASLHLLLFHQFFTWCYTKNQSEFFDKIQLDAKVVLVLEKEAAFLISS